MGENSAVGIICSLYETFFEAEKKIADCIIGRKAEVVGMTVAELARASGTSDATVSRFCRRCGFKGFQQLKISLAKEVMEDPGKAAGVSNEILRSDIAQSLRNILANKIAELTQTVSMLDPDALEAILQMLEKARSVQVAAVGSMTPVALDFCFKLNQLGIQAVSETIWDAQVAYTFNMQKADVVVVISSAGTSRRLQALVQGAKEKGCGVIAITNNSDSPVAKAADWHIITATREKLLLEESSFSRVSAAMVVEILYLLLAVNRQDSPASSCRCGRLKEKSRQMDLE